MIKYTNISYEKYRELMYKKSNSIKMVLKKLKPYCIEYNDGTKEYRINGIRHREDGPAVEHNAKNSWYLNDDIYSFEEWLELTPISNEEKVFLRIKYGK